LAAIALEMARGATATAAVAAIMTANIAIWFFIEII
jgi:hypothetical protein